MAKVYDVQEFDYNRRPCPNPVAGTVRMPDVNSEILYEPSNPQLCPGCRVMYSASQLSGLGICHLCQDVLEHHGANIRDSLSRLP